MGPSSLNPAPLRHALRSLAATPYFTFTAVASLGIGIGACTAVFTVIEAAYLAPLPYDEPDRLVEIWSTAEPRSLQRIDAVPAERVRRWLDADFRTLQAVAARAGTTLVLEGENPERVQGEVVSGGYFQMLGAAALVGRALVPADDQVGAEPAVVLSEGLWKERFSGDASVLGRAVKLSGEAYTVVGVMPERFAPDRRVWVPAASKLAGRAAAAWLPVARLREGASLEDAVVEVQRIAAAEVAADSIAFGGMGAVAIPFGQADRSGGAPTLWVLAGAVGVVFLLALTNLTTLLLVRAKARGRAAAVRVSLGASPWQAGSGLLLETLLLAAAGAAVGLLLAGWGKGLAGAAMGGRLANPVAPVVGVGAVVVAAGLALLGGAVVGLEPLRLMRKVDLRGLLHAGGATTTSGPDQRRTRNVIVAAQVGLTLTFAGAGGVLAAAYQRLVHLDLGYDAERVVAAYPDYEIRPMSPGDQRALGVAAAERLERRPDVVAATVWRMARQTYAGPPEYDAVFDGGATELHVRFGLYGYYDVGPNFFETLGIELVAGRDFGPADGAGSPAVGIISEGGARAWWPGQDPLGRRLRLGEAGEWITVVGVAEDAADLHRSARSMSVGTVTRAHGHLPRLYRPLAQAGVPPAGWEVEGNPYFLNGVVVAARVSDDPSSVAAALEAEMSTLAPDLPLKHVGTMADWQGGGYSGTRLRLYGGLAATVATAGMLLALLGIVGVVGDAIVRRTREIGLRKALGAPTRQVVAVLARESVLTASAGLGVGVLGNLALREVATGPLAWHFDDLLLGVPPADWRILATAGLGVLLATGLTACLCASRADRIEPAEALRAD